MFKKKTVLAEINMSKFMINESQIITVKVKWEGIDVN